MGRKYSVNGYLNATLRRSGKTLLVEGVTDKHSLHRLEVEKYPVTTGVHVIDHAGMFDDPLLFGLGNRDKILHIQTTADALAEIIPKISVVLATLMDREWDGLTFSGYLPTPDWTEPTQARTRFLTLGHSIENYIFDIECAKEFIKYSCAEYVTARMLAAVDQGLRGLLVLASVLSLKMRHEGCLTRCSGVVALDHLVLKNSRFYLNDSFGTACALRAVPSANSIVAEINTGVDGVWDRLAGSPCTRWIPHGHIGEEIFWTGVAQIANSEGMPMETANELAHGFKKDRDRFKAQWLASAPLECRVPLDAAIDWLHIREA